MFYLEFQMEFMFPKVTLNNSVLGDFDKEFGIQRGDKNGPLTLNFFLSPLPNAYEGGQWKVVAAEASQPILTQKGSLEVNETKQGIFSLTISEPQTIAEFLVVIDVFFCGESSCLKRTRKLKINFKEGTNETLQKSERSIVWDELVWS